MRVLLLGSTGTIGGATARALVSRGFDVVAYGRRAPDAAGVTVRIGELADIATALRGQRFDAFVSCLASRTGSPEDAWDVDHAAHSAALAAAKATGAGLFVLLSAICVQKPQLAFQHAKRAFERDLIASGLAYSIVRPTAYFKSLSGQVARVRAGKPFLLFGDGRLTSCKPVGDDDLASYIAERLTDASQRNRILPIGGPGPAIAPWDQAEALFGMLKKPLRVRRVPVGLLDGIIAVSATLGKASAKMRARAEFARIGRYYATESMLVWNEGAGRYSAQDTPETGSDTLYDFYARLIRDEASVKLGDHAAF